MTKYFSPHHTSVRISKEIFQLEFLKERSDVYVFLPKTEDIFEIIHVENIYVHQTNK